ncbi:dihydroorotate dehydrogenase (quinone), partial [Candidatus Woesearchaeota archaeon]|nr:dihydroorotate dehydrogenase (quinone) [Candidatus Woesearchaeota archaeon]
MTFVYEKLLRPILFLQDPEKIHNRAIRAGRIVGAIPPVRWLVSLFYNYKHAMLEQYVAGIKFKNPVGLAAGFDKDCQLMKSLPALGFGYEEVGSVTAQPYAGNPHPRLVRLKKDKGIIVNYGLKNEGAPVLKKRLQGKYKIPIGVSVAKTNKHHTTQKEKLDDWVKG